MEASTPLSVRMAETGAAGLAVPSIEAPAPALVRGVPEAPPPARIESEGPGGDLQFLVQALPHIWGLHGTSHGWQVRVHFSDNDEPCAAPADASDYDTEDDAVELPPGVQPPAHMVCPITLDLMRDPVVAADGHSYERRHMQRWLRQSSVSPKNNTALSARWLVPNHNLRACILEWIEAHTETKLHASVDG